MRVVMDYRPALRERSGAGEYTHQIARALIALAAAGEGADLRLTLFSSSWKDRFVRERELEGATIVDRRVPVRVLNYAWHRLEWPAIETLTGAPFDLTHSPHPLLLPTRSSAQVITIHDLDFLKHPERTRAEIRRDYPALVRNHAHRADQILTLSEFSAGEIQRLLGIPRERISICPPGAPAWPARRRTPTRDGYVLFHGTLEPRKNVGGLLDAYALLAARRRVPRLVLAGRATDAAAEWLDRIARPPLHGLVQHEGYIAPDARQKLYENAALVVQPSFEEGFGLPVLEAMTIGVPVVAADRGALPEVLGGAGVLVDPDAPEEIAGAIERVLDDAALAERNVSTGIERAKSFSWARAAKGVLGAYRLALEARTQRRGVA